MDAQNVDMFLMANSKYLEGHQMFQIRERLLAMDEPCLLYTSDAADE